MGKRKNKQKTINHLQQIVNSNRNGKQSNRNRTKDNFDSPSTNTFSSSNSTVEDWNASAGLLNINDPNISMNCRTNIANRDIYDKGWTGGSDGEPPIKNPDDE